MLNKQQSEVWKALGHGDQWVLRDELAELQKKAVADKPAQAPVTAKTQQPKAEPLTAAKANTSPAPASPTPIQRPEATIRTSASRPATTVSATSTLNAGRSASGTSSYSSRHVDIPAARAAKRIDFIKNADWQTLQQAVQDCTVCDIGKNRLNAVFGQGQPPADVVLIGEGPGRQEDEQGKIFVGKSGQLLDKILNFLKIKRGEDVAILNTLKCRPPQNANPSEPETAACRPFLERQLELLDPKLIVVMGKPALKWVLRKDVPVKTQRGRVQEVEVAGKKRKVIVTFHPSYLLRTPIDKGKAWLDWLLVLDTMRKLKNDGQSV